MLDAVTAAEAGRVSVRHARLHRLPLWLAECRFACRGLVEAWRIAGSLESHCDERIGYLECFSVVGTNIGYFSPETGYLIVGEVRDKAGTSITANRRAEITASKAKDLPLDKAIKIGSGSSTVIEFTDPDCPYCRKASTWFSTRTDTTRYVFFTPLPMHPDAENKAKYVLCADDRAKAYEEVMSGKLDKDKYETCKKPEVEDLLKANKDLAAKMGVNSTPFFIVNGKAISGADIPKLEEALKQGSAK